MSHDLALVFVVSGVAALALNLIGVELVRRWTASRRVLDVPNARSSHSVPTPRGGGLALVVVTILGCVAGAALGVVEPGRALVLIGGAASAIAAVSWLEDVRRVPLAARFVAHVLAAALVLLGLGGAQVAAVPLVGLIQLGAFGAGLAVVWIVGLANAFNFMDGIDGIAGGQALVAAIGWMLLAADDPGLRWIAMLLGAGSLGLLAFNWAPAKIFMGDVGAVFLGFCLAALPLYANRANPRMLVAGMLLVWPFIFDASFTLLRRLRRGENVLAAHRSHLYQRLVIAGYGHAAVSSIYIGLAIVGVMLARLWVTRGATSGPLIVGIVAAAALGLWAWTLLAERSRAGDGGAAAG